MEPRANRPLQSGAGIGRNDPCPCGSGKKYKHCHGRPAGAAAVLYVHPSKQGVEPSPPGAAPGRPYGLIPVGVAALVNLLREEGIVVQGVNYPLEKSLNASFDLHGWLRAHSAARLVLIDLHWYEHAYGAISTARACKAALPEAKVVLGGITASIYAQEILAHYPEVDYIVRGDAERPLAALAKRLLAASGRRPVDVSDIPNLSYRVNGQVVENPLGYCAAPADLDALNFVDTTFLEHAREYQTHEYVVVDVPEARRALEAGRPFRGRWLCNARGCRHECAYCGGYRSAHQAFAGRGQVVARSPSKMVEDVAQLARQGVHQASFSYDLVELGEAYWKALFEGLKARGVRIGLYNEVFQLPPPEFIKAFAECADLAHSCLAISPLSGSEAVRRLNGKPYTNESLLDACDLLSRYNVPIFVYFSLNLPGEDDHTIQETVDLAARLYHLYPPSLIKIVNSCHTLDPLSPMSVRPERYGLEVTMRTFRDYYAYCQATRFLDPAARTEAHRGFQPAEAGARHLERMAALWDAARDGRESSWWPLPPGW